MKIIETFCIHQYPKTFFQPTWERGIILNLTWSIQNTELQQYFRDCSVHNYAVSTIMIRVGKNILQLVHLFRSVKVKEQILTHTRESNEDITMKTDPHLKDLDRKSAFLSKSQ